MKQIILTEDEIAELFQVSGRQVRKYVQVGMPRYGTASYDLVPCFRWWFANIGEEKAAASGSNSTINEIKKHYWAAKAKSEVIKAKQLEDSVAPWDLIENEWAQRVVAVTTGLELFADRLPPLLEGRDQLAMREIIGDEVRYLRESYARTGKYTPQVEVELPEKSKTLPKKKRGRPKKVK